MSKIVVAMSGGVDSSVAAALLVEQGHEVVGVTMKLLARADTGFGCCGSPADVDDAKRVAETLGIPHYTVDMAELFADKVIKRFVDDYQSGRTPNPCVECNRSLKFGHLLGLAKAWNCDAVATGHYARVEDSALLTSVDTDKDQTYFLYSLTARELASVRFPVGALTKAQVREKARALGLRTADKPESMEICFVPRRDYRGFLASQGAQSEPGPIVDTSGREVGRHEGVANFTVGQRKGLGLTTKEPNYVVDIDAQTKTVVVGTNDDVFSAGCAVEKVSWTGKPESGTMSVRIRHRHAPALADVTCNGDTARVRFESPQRAVTAGQAAVFYRGDRVLGGGVIVRREARA